MNDPLLDHLKELLASPDATFPVLIETDEMDWLFLSPTLFIVRSADGADIEAIGKAGNYLRQNGIIMIGVTATSWNVVSGKEILKKIVDGEEE